VKRHVPVPVAAAETALHVVGPEGKVRKVVQHEVAEDHRDQAEDLQQWAGVPGRKGQHDCQQGEVEMGTVEEEIAEDD
jgi:hypothetical protein